MLADLLLIANAQREVNKMSMFDSKFEKAVLFVLENEGGCVYDKSDPGGETKYGISKRSHPNVDIKNLSLDDAKKIYYCEYWLKGKCGDIPDEAIATKFFDFIVLFGVRAATIVLQRAIRAGGIIIQDDGIFGSQTLLGALFCEAKILLIGLKCEGACYARLIAQKNPAQQKFLNGWLNRAYKDTPAGE